MNLIIFYSPKKNVLMLWNCRNGRVHVEYSASKSAVRISAWEKCFPLDHGWVEIGSMRVTK